MEQFSSAGYSTAKTIKDTRYKLNYWAAFVLIVVLCWVDYQYFTEGPRAIHLTSMAREVAHLLLLTALILTGYYGWYKHPMEWLKKLWIACYVAAVIIITGIGMLHREFYMFSVSFMKQVSDIRLFFCSPVPYFMLYILSLLGKDSKSAV